MQWKGTLHPQYHVMHPLMTEHIFKVNGHEGGESEKG